MSEGGSRVDRLLDGRLALRQASGGGHRAGTDAVLLAAAASLEPDDLVLDVGAGVGTIGLALALREPTARVLLLEREAEAAAFARDNIALNGLEERASVLEADLFAPVPAALPRASLLVSNPPFYAAGTVRLPAQEAKARAYALPDGDHGGWLRAMLRFAAPGARVLLVHRPEALPALLAAAERRLGGLHVRPVLPRLGSDATRILVGGIVGSRAGLTIAAPFVLHDETGAFTPEAEAVHRGQALIPLLPVHTRKSRPRGPASSSVRG